MSERAALKDQVFRLFSTQHSPESQADCLGSLMCCLPQVAAAGVDARALGYRNVFRPAIAVLDAPPSGEELQDAYFADLRKVLAERAESLELDQLTFIRSIHELTERATEFDGFITVGATVFPEADLRALHMVLPHGVCIDTNPAPRLFDSVRPDLSQTMLDALDAMIAAGRSHIAFLGGVGSIMGMHDYPEDIRELSFR